MEDPSRGVGKFSYERERVSEDGETVQNSECSVFITDIARGVTDENLKEKFRDYGTVVEAFVVKNKFTGETKGYGFVRFASMDEVYHVLDAKELPRFEDSVSHKIQMVKATIADAKDTLLIINIPRGWEESDLVKALTEVSLEPPRKVRFSGTGKTTAYASYTDHDQALRVLKSIQRPPNGLQSPPFAAYLAPPKFFDAKNAPTTKVLFVRGTAGLSSETLRKVFGGPELVEKCIVPTDSSRGGPIGHAFVHFYSTKAAADAKESMNGHEVDGARLSIEWCLPKNVTHKKAAQPYPFAYPYPYPAYPYYPEYDPYYPPPAYSGYPGYETYAAGAYEAPPARDSRRAGGPMDAYNFPRGHYQAPAYPSQSAAAGYPPSSYPPKGSSYRPPSPTSGRPPHPYHHHPSSSSSSSSSAYDRAGSRSSGGAYPPSSYSSRSSRYVPY